MAILLAEINPVLDEYEKIKGYFITPYKDSKELDESIDIESIPGLIYHEKIVYFQQVNDNKIVNSSWKMKEEITLINYKNHFRRVYNMALLKNIEDYEGYNGLGLNFSDEYKKFTQGSKALFYIEKIPPKSMREKKYTDLNISLMLEFIKKNPKISHFDFYKKKDLT